MQMRNAETHHSQQICCLVSDIVMPNFAEPWLEHISSELQEADRLPFLVSNYVIKACQILKRIREVLRREGDPAEIIGTKVLDLVAQAQKLNNTDILENQPIGEDLNLQFCTTYRIAVIKLYHYVVILLSSLNHNVNQQGPLAGINGELSTRRVSSLHKIRRIGQQILSTARRLLHDTNDITDTSIPSGALLSHNRQYDFPLCWADAHRLIPAISVVAALPSMEPEQRNEAGLILKTIGMRFRIRQALVGYHHVAT